MQICQNGPVTLCMLGNFSFFCRLLSFLEINFLKKSSFRDTIKVSNGFDPDQDRDFVGPDLHTGKCIRRFGGIYAHCWYFIGRKL